NPLQRISLFEWETVLEASSEKTSRILGGVLKTQVTVRATRHRSDFRSGRAKICLPSKGELAV
ncbi:MAG: hypothetical protein ACE5HO_15050, partial [bacterium]